MTARRDIHNDIRMLMREVENLDSNGGFSANQEFIDNIRNVIDARIRNISRKNYEIDRRDFNRDFLKNYNKLKGALANRHIGLSRYNLNQIEPDLRELFRINASNALDLIKTQNEITMQRLKLRFLDWVSLRSDGIESKKTLRQMVELPNNRHMKFILKDQSNKVSAAMDNAIATRYKAIAFEWRTQQDKRVVGNPSGLYPEVSNERAHGDHYNRHGKYYIYKANFTKEIKKQLNLSQFEGFDTDLKDGMPGTPIGCRCYAKNYYDIQDLPKILIKN